VIGHKEWAGASQGKWDPGGIDMDDFRADVQTQIDNGEGDWLDMPGNAEKLDYIYNELHKLFGSRSPYRSDDNGFDTLAGRLLDTERQVNMAMVETAAHAGEAWALDLVSRVASGSDEHAGN